MLPSLAATLPAPEAAFLGIRNGFLLRPKDGDLVGGAQGFDVTWSGALLVEEEGNYEFWAGAPTPCGEKPNWEAAERCRWRAVLKRGSRSWVILSHQWPGEEERLVGVAAAAPRRLRAHRRIRPAGPGFRLGRSRAPGACRA